MVEVVPTKEDDTYRLILSRQEDDIETYGLKMKKKDLYDLHLKLKEIFKEI